MLSDFFPGLNISTYCVLISVTKPQFLQNVVRSCVFFRVLPEILYFCIEPHDPLQVSQTPLTVISEFLTGLFEFCPKWWAAQATKHGKTVEIPSSSPAWTKQCKHMPPRQKPWLCLTHFEVSRSINYAVVRSAHGSFPCSFYHSSLGLWWYHSPSDDVPVDQPWRAKRQGRVKRPTFIVKFTTVKVASAPVLGVLKISTTILTNLAIKL